MGAWGAGNFSNDTALDFISSLASVDSVASVVRAKRLSPIDADTAGEVLAAADLVAAMMDRPALDMPENALDALGGFEFPENSLLKDTRRAVEQVRDHSELAELWAEDDDQEWRDVIDDLLARLDPESHYEIQQPAEDTLGPIFGICFVCEESIKEDEIVNLVHEIDDGIVSSTMTLYAHRACVEKTFNPPHWNSDGSPSAAVLEQFADSLSMTDDD